MRAEPDEYDGSWKEALEVEFEAFLQFLFPEVHAGIDWSQAPEFLEQELRQITPEAAIGLKIADKLAKVRRAITRQRSSSWLTFARRPPGGTTSRGAGRSCAWCATCTSTVGRGSAFAESFGSSSGS